MKYKILFLFLFTVFTFIKSNAQSLEIGKDKHLIYHDIRTDVQGHILPWFDSDPAIAYDHILNLTWTYWKNIPGYWMRKTPNFKQKYGIQFPPLYLLFRTQDPEDLGIGGGQFAQMLSSFNLYYDYTGDTAILSNMKFQADWYINHSLSDSLSFWPNLPFPCNTELLPVYDGDLVLGKGYTQPDKAGDFGYELAILYKKTGNLNYLKSAVKIANTLASQTKEGDYSHSPLPFKVNTNTGEVGYIFGENGKTKTESVYTSNWTGTLRLFQELIGLGEENTITYQRSFNKILAWMKIYPLKNNRWGPFFEDITLWSDTEMNAGLMAQFIMDNPSLFPEWKKEIRGIQDWVLANLGLDYWKQYGLQVIGEQTIYKVQGQSHTARHASIELQYAKMSGNQTKVQEAIRQLNWCTYAVDFDGKNKWPHVGTYEIWWSDGYGDYIRHFLRAMAANPSLAPAKSHILKSTSVLKNVEYSAKRIKYQIFDKSSSELIRLASMPKKVIVDGKNLSEVNFLSEDSWIWQPLNIGGVMEIRHSSGNQVEIVLN